MPKMRSSKVTEARRAANDRYDAKTYKRISLALRLKEDADILGAIEKARAEGVSAREWLRNLFDKANG